MDVQKYKEVVRLLDSLSTLIDDSDTNSIARIKDKYNKKLDSFSLHELVPHNATPSEFGSFRSGLKKMVIAVYKNDADELYDMCEKTTLPDHLIYSKIQCSRKLRDSYRHWRYNTVESKAQRKMLCAVDKLIKTEIIATFYEIHKSKLILR
jgi:hypothetical protein